MSALRDQAREWLELGDATILQHGWCKADLDSLTVLLERVRDEAIEDCAKIADAHSQKLGRLTDQGCVVGITATKIRALRTSKRQAVKHVTCWHCDKWFWTLTSLWVHLQTHHKGKL